MSEFMKKMEALRTDDAKRLAGVAACFLREWKPDEAEARNILLAACLGMTPERLMAAHEEVARVGLGEIRWVQ